MMDLLSSLPLPALVTLEFSAGLMLGLAHFAGLARVTCLYLSGGAVGRAFALQIGRFLLLIMVLGALAFAGATPLLSAALGLLTGRAIVLRYSRRGM